EATLVPRPESETLIEAALEAINRRHPGASRNPGGLSVGANGIAPLRILDLGTGSGCLLLALLHELPNATGLGVDASHRAVEQAKINAETLGLAARAEFRVNDWADGVEDKFDLVISNPPYVAQGDIVGLMPEVRDFDPALALDGGVDGLNVYRFLIPQLPGLLKPGSAAIFEIGAGQAKAVSNLFRATGFTNIETRKDLSGVERCIIAQK
ncbi:MAG TPA: peptide chain release factor N(5)-glutamine methyltransferase, partial [Alphaproteobacteria bacterium]|nr:peptide chain release factor N(5)-glutamine methyltransferase [Alphaproteobacteria bacterium]